MLTRKFRNGLYEKKHIENHEVRRLLQSHEEADTKLGEFQQELNLREDHGKKFRDHLTTCNAKKFKIECETGLVDARSALRDTTQELQELQESVKELRKKAWAVVHGSGVDSEARGLAIEELEQWLAEKEDKPKSKSMERRLAIQRGVEK